MSDVNIRIAGSGGQGVILATIILADAALNDGKYAAQSQSYGPEARGGACKAEVVISDDPIDFPKVELSDFFLALTQDSLNKYLPQCKKGSTVMIDSTLDAPETGDYKIIKAPILETARVVLCKPVTANIIAVGTVGNYLQLAELSTIEEAVLNNVPKGTIDINRTALYEGFGITLEEL